MKSKVLNLIDDEIVTLVDANFPDARDAEPDYGEIYSAYVTMTQDTGLKQGEIEGLGRDDLVDLLEEDADKTYEKVEARFGPETMRDVERHILLAVIDRLWVEHLTEMDDLREGVGLQAYGQKDPLVVYKTEGYNMYQQLLRNIQHDVAYTIYRVQPVIAQQPVRTRVTEEAMATNREDGQRSPRRKRKIGANDPCWCGSGKKYKRCHGAVTSRAAV